MTQNLFDQYEDIIANELCAYQAQLDLGESPNLSADRINALPAEAMPILDELRHCLELLNSARNRPKCAKSESSLKPRSIPDSSDDTFDLNRSMIHDLREMGQLQLNVSDSQAEFSRLPSQIGRFKIITQLGVGGFGIVFLGIDPIIGREVAIKIPRLEQLASAEQIERFGREAEAAAQLDHPNIVSVYESGYHGTTRYIVMPYIPGTTLSRWRTNHSEVSPRITADIVRQLALGVAHAHERGVLHRDIKPGNVLMAPLEDSGKSNDHARAATMSNSDRAATNSMPSADRQLITSGESEMKQSSDHERKSIVCVISDWFKKVPNSKFANLMSPRRSITTASTDIPFVPKLTDFGLAKIVSIDQQETRTGTVIGTTGYMAPEQVEGRSSDITARSDVYGLGAVLYELLTGAPPFQGENEMQTVRNIILNDPLSLRITRPQIPKDLEVICLKCLEKRPENRYASAAALADDLQRFLDGEPISARPVSLVTRTGKWCRRHPLRAAFVGSVIIGLLSLVSVSLWYNSRLTKLLLITERERQSARQSELVSTQGAYVSDMRNACAEWYRANVTQMLNLLERYRPSEGEPDVRDFAWRYLWREYNESSRILGTHGTFATAVAITRGGEIAASGGFDSTIRLWSLPSGKLLTELHGHKSGTIESLDFSPDGNRLVSAGEDGTVRVWNVKSGKELFVRREHELMVSQAVYSPNGEVIASCGGDNMIRLWNAESGEPIGILTGHTKRVRCLAFHPAEPILVSGSLDDTLRIWNLDALCPDQRVKDGIIWQSIPYARSLVFDPYTNDLIIGTMSAELVALDLKDPNAVKELHRESSIPVRGLNWPPGGRLTIASSQSEIQVGNRLGLKFRRNRMWGHRDVVLSAASNADGTHLVSASQDGCVRFWPQFQNRSWIATPHIGNRDLDDTKSGYTLQWVNPFLAADFQEEGLLLFRMPDGALERTFPKPNSAKTKLSPSGKLLLICETNGQLRCVKVSDGKVLMTQQISPEHLENTFNDWGGIEISQDERYVVISRRNELIVFSLVNFEVIHRLIHPEGTTGTVRWIRGFKLIELKGEPPRAISICFEGEIRVWNIQDGSLLRSETVPATTFSCFAISGDYRLIASTTSEGIVRVWRVEDLAEIARVSQIKTLTTGTPRAEFLPNSQNMIFHHDSTNNVMFWNLQNESELMSIPEQSLGQFAISPDGNQVALMQASGIRIIDARPILDSSGSTRKVNVRK